MLWSGLRDMPRMGLSVPFAYHVALGHGAKAAKTKTNKQNPNLCGAGGVPSDRLGAGRCVGP